MRKQKKGCENVQKYNPQTKEEHEFLKNYTTGKYQKPSLTADNIVFRENPQTGVIEVLLIKRKNYPFKGMWAFPGGFVNKNESADQASQRELTEETGVRNVQLEQLYFASDPNRDPRGWIVSAVYTGFVSSDTEPQAGDDAMQAKWIAVDTILMKGKEHKTVLAFDHDMLLRMALLRIGYPF